MRILIVGSGGREHALAWALSRDEGANQVVCAPGNSGIARTVRCLPLNPNDPNATLALAAAERIDLTVVGPEAPLDMGVGDLFVARGRRLFGPTRAAARLETSKAFAKGFMARHGVPTARYRVCASADEARAVIGSRELGEAIVVKADGLAAGKGVVVAENPQAAEAAVEAAMITRRFGEAGACVVLEERLEGPEVSFFVVTDGTQALPLVSAQDHKRAFDGDEGPNTGGMGALAPSSLVDGALAARIGREVVEPVLKGMREEGHPFQGFLYCGLMLTADGPRVIEFNARLGDPEAQVVLPLIDEPLAPLLWEAVAGQLTKTSCRVRPEASVGVVLAAAGYPHEIQTGQLIEGLDRVERECPDVLVFHAGVRDSEAGLATAGGRVLTLVGLAPTFDTAVARAYDAVSRVRFEGMHYRRDIGRNAKQIGSLGQSAAARR